MGHEKPFAGLALLLLAAAPAAAGEVAERLGTVDFPVSCSAEAQQQFNRAMALYHSFYWGETREALDSVLAADPACAMAHWGHAMVKMENPYIWPLTGDALPQGLAAVEQARAIGARTERERDYIAAVELFYRDHDRVDHKTRAAAYEHAMAELAERYPEDLEARVLYALVLSASFDPTDKSYSRQLQAAEILEKAFAEHPEHPGVAHYLIHSYDYPPLAERGVEAARRFSQVAASTPHALHMPSHIFTRLGYWEDSIASNIASADAAKDARFRLHAWDYLVYAYLQSGRDDDARRIVEATREVTTAADHKTAQFVMAYAFAAIPARYALERGRWAEAAALALQPDELAFPWASFPHAEAVNAYARALGAARSGEVEAARAQVARLMTLREAMLAAKQGYWAEQAEIQAEVARAWISWAEGRSSEAVQRLRAAADREDATEKNVVTPGSLAPAREQLGEMLLELEQPAAALEQFESSIGKDPNRWRGLHGAGRAAELGGESAKAASYYTRLTALDRKAGADRPELEHARAFLARD
jgi:tetratricopeptide (TPR) repeat protein